MELKSSQETDDYRYFDPKLLRATDSNSVPRNRSPFQEVSPVCCVTVYTESPAGPPTLWGCHLQVHPHCGAVTCRSTHTVELSPAGPPTLWCCHLQVHPHCGAVTCRSTHTVGLSTAGPPTLWSCWLGWFNCCHGIAIVSYFFTVALYIWGQQKKNESQSIL